MTNDQRPRSVPQNPPDDAAGGLAESPSRLPNSVLNTPDSQPSTRCRVLIDPEANSGSWNMAVDEVLLESAIRDGRCTLRLYRWREATVSLGYFQESSAARAVPELAGLPVVRRLSGGGAILHHHELTYSCALPATHALARSPHQLYERVHERIIAVLSHQGIAAEMRGRTSGQAAETFLCFSRSDPRDIVFRGHKVLGSAQRRRRGALLQHGSLLLRHSAHAPAHPGILDLSMDTRLDDHLSELIAVEVAEALGRPSVPGQLNEQECRDVSVLQQQKYGSLNWRRRPTAFNR